MKSQCHGFVPNCDGPNAKLSSSGEPSQFFKKITIKMEEERNIKKGRGGCNNSVIFIMMMKKKKKKKEK